MLEDSDEDTIPRPIGRKRSSPFGSTSSESSNRSMHSPTSPVIGRFQRRVLNILPDSSDSDTSSSSLILMTNKRRRPVKMDSDSDSDTSSTEIMYHPKKVHRLISDSESDSSDSNSQSEKCPICLLSFKNQETATPVTCQHQFCLDCLLEWSKNMNTCPVDRKKYELVFVRSKFNGKIVREVIIKEPNNQQLQNDDSFNAIVISSFEDLTLCEICGSSNDEEEMLLCDGCDHGYHLYCLTPPLDGVPQGEWFCETCNQHVTSLPRNRNNRLFPRTRRIERVRSQIAAKRRRRRQKKKCKKKKSTSKRRNNDSLNSNLPFNVQNGVPQLHLFDLPGYYSPIEDEDYVDGEILIRRAPNHNDVGIMRRLARKKTLIIPPTNVPTSSDVLSSILDIQTQFFAKSTSFSLDKNGKFQISCNNNYINLNNINKPIGKQTPNTNNEVNSNVENHSQPTSTVETTTNSNSNSLQENSQNNDCTQHNLCENNERNNDSGSDIDIYSDIETVSTSKVEENSPKQPQQLTSDDENNDSELDMVIDTEKVEETTVSSTTKVDLPTSTTTVVINKDKSDDEELDTEDGCPNFNIYSKESINMAKNTDIGLELNENQVGEISSSPNTTKNEQKISSGLYSDSEDENIVKKDLKSFEISDLRNMTEDIVSEEERSYTPCLDERINNNNRQGLEGLDTEMISDEDRNDFDESHELKTNNDGDALEINAKESEIEFTRPEDFEEGEIVDKLKAKKQEAENKKEEKEEKKQKANKENNNGSQNKESSFKKLSKSNKERNYRERSKSQPKEKPVKKKKEKRKEIERYDVRAILNPRRIKDRFGRDVCLKNNSVTPPPPSTRRSDNKKRRRSRTRSRNRRSSRTRSRSFTPPDRSKTKKRKRSSSASKKRKSRERSKKSRRSTTPQRKKRDWRTRDWTPSLSRSRTPEIRHLSPSWTPPRVLDQQQQQQKTVKPHNLTVILNNDNRKKKDKKKKSEKKNKDRRRRNSERTPPPSKEVFASGDNILVSVSFNKENETRDVTTTTTRRSKKDITVQEDEEVDQQPPPITTTSTQQQSKIQKKDKKQKKKKEIPNIKPVAIIDLERSPFKELTPSPKDIIVLSDSDNGENNVQKVVCDSSQQVASPSNYAIGPKTPPEPQVKFLLPAKQPTLRAINNPLHEPDDLETNDDDDVQDEYNKGPNTPPEPPNSPPSSPDAYDPFEPTKSRSPTPQLPTNEQQNDGKQEDIVEESNINDVQESLTPPFADIQPADSQSSIHATPESNLCKSPIQTQPTSIVQTTIATSLITTTPVSSNITPNRINILSTSLLQPATIQQRIISPTKSISKSSSSPVKMVKTNVNNRKNRSQNGDESNNMDLDSPYSPGSSDYEDLFEPPAEKPKQQSVKQVVKSSSPTKIQSTFDALFGSPIYNKNKTKIDTKIKFTPPVVKKPITPTKGGSKQVGVKLDEDNLKILDDLPNSAVEMQVKDKFLKKLNRQERVVEEVKLVLKPHYNKKRINKEEYKDILRRAVPKICHNKSGEINPTKIKNLIEAYVKKIRHSKKVTSSSSSVNPQKA